jgi:hypothetical protein
MPAKSAKAYRYFQAVAHGNAKAGGKDAPSKAVAREMIAATSPAKRSAYSRGKR